MPDDSRCRAPVQVQERAGGARSQGISTCPRPHPPLLETGISGAGWLPLSRTGAGAGARRR
ncbi:hypothetical protein, partial [Chloroflexus aurantiacus]